MTHERPDWLADGQEVYVVTARGSWDGYHFRKGTVTGGTKTQVKVTIGSHEARYRLSDLKEVGRNEYTSPQLAPPDDRRVLAEKQRLAVKAAMGPLVEAHTEYSSYAKIHTGNLELARQVAEAFRSAAQHALDTLPTALEGQP